MLHIKHNILQLLAQQWQDNLRVNNGNYISHSTVLVFGASTETTDCANSLQ